MPLESELRIQVIESFKAILQSLAVLREHMLEIDADLPVWFAPPPYLLFNSETGLREKAFRLLAQLEYIDGQDPREILVGPGLIAASEKTLLAIESLNAVKNEFKKAMISLKAHHPNNKDPFLNESFEALLESRPNITQEVLRKIGLARLHLKQTYRRIPYFSTRPTKVSWTWANTRAIKRISVQAAEIKLKKMGSDIGIEQQLTKLYTLQQDEPLAIIQELAPHLRANVVLPINAHDTKRMMVKGPIPLFYLHEPHTGLPDIRPPGSKKGRDQNRPIRSDVLIDSTPFLTAIHAHRYLKHSLVPV